MEKCEGNGETPSPVVFLQACNTLVDGDGQLDGSKEQDCAEFLNKLFARLTFEAIVLDDGKYGTEIGLLEQLCILVEQKVSDLCRPCMVWSFD